MQNALLFAAILLLGGCTAQAPVIDMPAHHTPEGFKNLYIDDPDKSFFDYLRMRFFGDARFADHARLSGQVPWQQSDETVIRKPGLAPQITWLGHSTFLLQHKGINVLTDPIFSDRASPVTFAGPKRYVPHTLDYAGLPDIDLVIISHNHYDHLDAPTIRALSHTTRFAVPLGLAKWLVNQGVPADNIIELDWWQQRKLDNTRIQALPSQHWSARGLGDRFDTLWASWSINIAGFHIWFAGDTGYNTVQFKQIGERIPQVDLALIPIGAYAPRWFMQPYHVNPEEAVKIHNDVGARRSIGMHWGTFPLTAEPPMEPVQRLEKALRDAGIPQAEFDVIAVGQTQTFKPVSPKNEG